MRDKFEWTDKTTTPWQYEVLEGSNRLTTKPVDLKMNRSKKKDLRKQNDTNSEFEHSSKPISDRGIVSFSSFSNLLIKFNILITSRFNDVI